MGYQRSRRTTEAQRRAIEDAYLNSLRQQHTYLQPQDLCMSPEDTAYCQQAIDLANSSERQQAYKRFCALYNHGNTENVTLLFWLARTTPFLEEAQRAMGSIEHLEPNHPNLPGLRNLVSKWPQKGVSTGKSTTRDSWWLVSSSVSP